MPMPPTGMKYDFHREKVFWGNAHAPDLDVFWLWFDPADAQRHIGPAGQWYRATVFIGVEIIGLLHQSESTRHGRGGLGRYGLYALSSVAGDLQSGHGAVKEFC